MYSLEIMSDFNDSKIYKGNQVLFHEKNYNVFMLYILARVGVLQTTNTNPNLLINLFHTFLQDFDIKMKIKEKMIPNSCQYQEEK